MARMKSRAPAQSDRDAPWALPMLRGPRYSQSLERGLAILGCFTSERPVQGIAEIAAELGMSRSTTHRYVTTLQALGYLEQGSSRKYRLGLRVTQLGMSALSSTGLREQVRPFLQDLRQRTTYTASLAMLDGTEILVVDRARSWRRDQRELDDDLQPGARLPAHCTAMGKALLAHLPERVQRDRVAEITLRRATPNTLPSKQALRAELEQIAEDGLAVDRQELRTGRQAIAAPVRDDSGEATTALGLSASTEAIAPRELVEALGPHLLATASRISARLGYRRPDER